MTKKRIPAGHPEAVGELRRLLADLPDDVPIFPTLAGYYPDELPSLRLLGFTLVCDADGRPDGLAVEIAAVDEIEPRK